MHSMWAFNGGTHEAQSHKMRTITPPGGPVQRGKGKGERGQKRERERGREVGREGEEEKERERKMSAGNGRNT